MRSGTVSIIGRPNSGKSTLLNLLVGQKVSIVSDKPQTTRHRILGIHTEPRGQIHFVDTPGIHKPGFRMNQRMLHAAYAALEDVDLVLHVVDGTLPFGAGDNYVLGILQSKRTRAFLLINKMDRLAKPMLLPIMDRYRRLHDFLEIVPVSALTGENHSLLLDLLFSYLPEAPASSEPDQLTDRSERFLSAELIREKLLRRTRQELPYTTAILVRKFDEGRRAKEGLVVIEADILVEKRSQQGIILGKAGESLRDIGTAARREIELLLGCRVYLALHVRTVSRWRNNDSILDALEVGG